MIFMSYEGELANFESCLIVKLSEIKTLLIWVLCKRYA